MIFAENHWRHRDISKGNFGKFLENFWARAEDRSIAPFSKTEAPLLDRVGRKGGKTLLVKSGSKGRSRPGKKQQQQSLGVGYALSKFGHLLTVETGGFDVCAGGQKECESIRLKAWQALPVEEQQEGCTQEPSASVRRT